MSRRLITKKRRHQRVQLNASLDDQLVIDFNRAAQRQGEGTRDTLLGEMIRSYLQELAPRSEPLRNVADLDSVRKVAKRATEREALLLVRELATRAVAVIDEVLGQRRGPKAAVPKKAAKRQAS
jgi:metal-responsive CopG/Arc/MetJ family transcriptional regulator